MSTYNEGAGETVHIMCISAAAPATVPRRGCNPSPTRYGGNMGERIPAWAAPASAGGRTPCCWPLALLGRGGRAAEGCFPRRSCLPAAVRGLGGRAPWVTSPGGRDDH